MTHVANQRVELCLGRVDGACPPVCPALESLTADEAAREAWDAQPRDVRQLRSNIAIIAAGVRHPHETIDLAGVKALIAAAEAGECTGPVVESRFRLKIAWLGIDIPFGRKTVCQNTGLPQGVREARSRNPQVARTRPQD